MLASNVKQRQLSFFLRRCEINRVLATPTGVTDAGAGYFTDGVKPATYGARMGKARFTVDRAFVYDLALFISGHDGLRERIKGEVGERIRGDVLIDFF